MHLGGFTVAGFVFIAYDRCSSCCLDVGSACEACLAIAFQVTNLVLELYLLTLRMLVG